jgi:arylsulfatase A-like enzyme
MSRLSLSPSNRRLISSLRTLLALVIAWFLPLALGASPSYGQDEGPPNILILLVDDLGYGDLSSYGATDLETPHIDALVEAGMRFDRFYANSPVCSPTRAALLSGQYPERVGVPGVVRTHARNNWGYLDPEAVLIPEVLKRAGYHTGMVGKWHLGLDAPNRPNDHGFDFFHGYLGDMMDDYYTHRRHGINYMRRNTQAIAPEGHATDLFTTWAVDYIHERSASSAPFFLYLAYNAPHSPIQPPDTWLQRVQQREPDISDERASIVALIEHMDAGIGEVVDALKDTNEYENTLILFASDNGGATYFGATNGPLRGEKQEVYEGGIRVPMAAVWPGHIEAGTRSDAVALTMDLYPTVADAANVPLDHAIDGISILPTLEGDDQSLDDRTVFFTRREGGNRYMGKTIWAVRQGDWKLLQNSPMAPFELYNLADDPREQNDLAGEEREVYNRLAEALRRHIQRGGRVPWQKP